MNSYNVNQMYKPNVDMRKILLSLLIVILSLLFYWSNHIVINDAFRFTLVFIKQGFQGIL